MRFKDRVYQQEFKLNDTDDSIVEYIKTNIDNIPNISIQKIAEELFLAPNAVMRLAKKLGYSGFSELKFSIQKEQNPDIPRTAEYHVLERMPQNIVKSLDVIEEDILQAVVKHMIHANKIVFIGVGDSVFFCEMLGKNLRCLDKKVEYYQQIHDMEYSISHCTHLDMAIIISASGENERLYRLIQRAKHKKMKVAGITHYGNNPISEIVDFSLYFWGEKRMVNGYNVTDRSGLMMLIRMISEKFWKDYCV